MTEKKTLAELSGWMMPKAKRSNATWCTDEDSHLLYAIIHGAPIERIASEFERTKRSIVMRAAKIEAFQKKALQLMQEFLATQEAKDLMIGKPDTTAFSVASMISCNMSVDESSIKGSKS